MHMPRTDSGQFEKAWVMAWCARCTTRCCACHPSVRNASEWGKSILKSVDFIGLNFAHIQMLCTPLRRLNIH
jgi:hypothetical protein